MYIDSPHSIKMKWKAWHWSIKQKVGHLLARDENEPEGALNHEGPLPRGEMTKTRAKEKYSRLFS